MKTENREKDKWLCFRNLSGEYEPIETYLPLEDNEQAKLNNVCLDFTGVLTIRFFEYEEISVRILGEK